MNLLEQVEVYDLLGETLESSYKTTLDGLSLFTLRFKERVVVVELGSPGMVHFRGLKNDAWLHLFNRDVNEVYYKLACFFDKKISNVSWLVGNTEVQVYEFSFEGETKRLRINAFWQDIPYLGLEIIRPGLTVNFGNKSILEVYALITNLPNLDYTLIPMDVREAYYYYSTVDNLYDLAEYLYNCLSKTRHLKRQDAFDLALSLTGNIQ